MRKYDNAIRSLYDRKFKLVTRQFVNGNSEDLMQMSIEALLNIGEDKIIKLHENNELDKYFYKVIKNQVTSKYSQYNKLFNQKYIGIDDIESKENEITDKEAAKIDSLDWDDKILLNTYTKLGSVRKVSVKVKTHRALITKKINTIKSKLKAIRILAITPAYGGVEFHRLITPLDELNQDDGFIVDKTQVGIDDVGIEHLKKYDIVIFNRNISNPVREKGNKKTIHLTPSVVFGKLKDAGVKVVCDIDDYWLLPKHHIAARFYSEKGGNFSRCTENNMKLSDHIFVTTKELKSKVMDLIKLDENIHIVPNAINLKDPQFNVPRVKSDKIRFLYQGGVTHLRDIKLITNNILVRGTKKIDAVLVLAGYVKGIKVWENIVKEFKKVFTEVQTVDGCKPNEYAKVYAQADICLVPLEDNEFNKHKSELKVLEAAAYGLPVIVSGVKPYTNICVHMNNAYVINPKRNIDWIKGIKSMMSNRDLRYLLAGQLKEDVDKHYNFEKITELRKELFRKILK